MVKLLFQGPVPHAAFLFVVGVLIRQLDHITVCTVVARRLSMVGGSLLVVSMPGSQKASKVLSKRVTAPRAKIVALCRVVWQEALHRSVLNAAVFDSLKLVSLTSQADLVECHRKVLQARTGILKSRHLIGVCVVGEFAGGVSR